MRVKTAHVRDLAREAEIDVIDALVILWDAGFDQIEDEDSIIPSDHVRSARAALGLDDERQMMNVAYWLEKGGLSRSEFAEVLSGAGVHLSPNVRRIPKNSLRRIRSLFADEQARDQSEAVEAPSALPPLKWRRIGATPIRRYLDESEVEGIHEALTEDFQHSGDPIFPPGVKDPNAVSSAAHRPRTSLGEHLKYPSAEMAAAALFHSVVLDHAFFNGNKRTAIVSLLAFLDENGLVMTCSEDDILKLTLKVAQHALLPDHADDLADREVQEIAIWIRSNTRPIVNQDRTMRWHKLRSKLSEFDCTLEPATGVGNRMNIYRDVVRPSRFGRTRTETLRTQVAWAGDASECDRTTIRKIRVDLELDDAHNIDSSSFYEGAKIDAFIVDYRRILRRLARL